MKIKLSFITNSSSCAYCLWGIELSDSDLNEETKKTIWQKYNKSCEERPSAWRKPMSYEEFLEKEDFICYIRDEMDDLIDNTSTDDGLVFGLGPECMEDSEKLIEFKQRIIDKLNKLGFQLDVNRVKFYNGIREC